MPAVQFFRVRFLLRMTGKARLHAAHHATLYALVSAAYGRQAGVPPVMPDGLLLDAPEQCRVSLNPDARYAFGATLLHAHPRDAARQLRDLVSGLRDVGRRAAPQDPAFGGNFEIAAVEDLVAAAPWRPTSQLTPIPTDRLQAECRQLAQHDRVTLRFHSPLRTHQSKHRRSAGHGYFDRRHFDPRQFLSRLQRRLSQLGCHDPPAPRTGEPSDDGLQTSGQISRAELLDNQLVWLDISYGPRQRRDSLGGAVGSVALGRLSEVEKTALVLGQYARVGGNTRFGFGAYRIHELGHDPYPCHRAEPPLRLAFAATSLDRAAAQYELESGAARRAAEQALAGDYQPDPHTRMEIVSAKTGKRRVLAIPSRRDRTLQRAVLDWFAPGLDAFWEDSSLAYRQGLGRQRAARRVADAFRKGFRWAVRADFASFFDRVPHDELAARVQAYLNDGQSAELIMRWVRAGAPSPDHGLPTGAPLSPVLANLLLDQFDEQIAADGGFLIRYADDFLILFRDRDQADRVFQLAEEAASALQLALNENKGGLVDLTTPFEFLGFRFERRGDWQATPRGTPCELEQLGWHESTRPPPQDDDRLPGESEIQGERPRSTVIVGPGVRQLDQQGGQLLVTFDDERPVASLPLRQLRELLVLGKPSLSHTALSGLVRHGVTAMLIDDAARSPISLLHDEPLEHAETLARQALVAADESRRLPIARALIAAKLANYAALAHRYRGRRDDQTTSRKLRRLADKARETDSVEELLGIEGSGAAAWYARFEERLPGHFSFAARVAPRAEDPVNVLLNFAQTVLHRHLFLLIRQVGMAASLGILHRPRTGHAALASDLQEPFRHLMDRAVVRTLQRLTPGEFSETGESDFPLRLSPRATRELLAQVHRVLARSCHGRNQSAPRPYRYQALRTARSLRAHLLDPAREFEVFEHP